MERLRRSVSLPTSGGSAARGDGLETYLTRVKLLRVKQESDTLAVVIERQGPVTAVTLSRHGTVDAGEDFQPAPSVMMLVGGVSP